MLNIEITNSVACITLNRPEKRNALTVAIVAQIGRALKEVDESDEVSAIILTGVDPAFCAGFDLHGIAAEDPIPQRDRQESGEVENIRGLLPNHVTPIIGAINGAAVTGGLELALGCDFLIASERARFADTHARVGLMPGGGITIRLPERIGISRARQMSFTGDFIDAPTALSWGLVNEVVPHEDLLARAQSLGESIASIPRKNVREIRSMYAEMGEISGSEAYATELRVARTWMAQQFDAKRLEKEAANIIDRGSAQQ